MPKKKSKVICDKYDEPTCGDCCHGTVHDYKGEDCCKQPCIFTRQQVVCIASKGGAA